MLVDHSNTKLMMIQHVVCIQFKDSAKPEQIQRIEKEFIGLSAKIKGIRKIEWGRNNSTEELNKDFTHCFIVTFENEQARQEYLPHPQHKAFVATLKPILEDVFVIDFTP